ncbi:late competence development ComFB family protein [Glaciecola sp. 1036]|uniref:late competence development ComFB family protein n=1 Tax=Alteromonadaceae TaxID=72275 RepID=UPI003D00E25E
MKIDNDIHNYYEHLVSEKIDELGIADTHSADYIADIVCLALNQLPPRYIRYEVDMAFYLPNSERLQMAMNVENAVKKAVNYLNGAGEKRPKEATK